MNRSVFYRRRNQSYLIQSFILLFVWGILFALNGCKGSENRDGNSFRLTDIQLMEDQVWLLGKTDNTYSLYRNDTGNLVKEFPEGVSVRFSSSHSRYFYTFSGELFAYNPVLDSIIEYGVQVSPEAQVFAVTEHYALLSDRTMVSLTDCTLSDITDDLPYRSRILDIADNQLLLWDDSNNALVRYDCDSDQIELIYRREHTSASVITAGLMLGDAVCYVDSQTGLNRIRMYEPGVYSMPQQQYDYGGNVVDITTVGEDILLVVNDMDDQGGTLRFVRIFGSKHSTAAVWENAFYSVPGSCITRTNDSKVACLITTEQQVFLSPME